MFAVLIWRCAWVSDDAFITLRTVDNLLNGHGLRWNVAERVQTYTHPLWMLLLIVPHAIGGEPYYGTLLLSGATSLLAVGVLWFGVARGPWSALAACAPLLMSKAFIDFSTSGLENPLTHLWLALLVMSVGRGGGTPAAVLRTATLVWSSALVRPDLPVLFGPALLVHLAAAGFGRRAWLAAAAGAGPLVAWELFSFVYYGSFVPNTALAKLGAGIERGELLIQGGRYLMYTVYYDPITAAACLLGTGLLVVRRDALGGALAAGSAAYVAYVVWVGGDFMGGRFLTPVLFALALGVARLDVGPTFGVVTAVGALLIGAPNPHAPLWSGVSYERAPAWQGVIDERGYYHRGAGLLATRSPVSHGFAREGRQAQKEGPHTEVRATIGYFGYYAGPEVHVVDRLALGEPLLARLPARYDPTWRIGHFRRDVPAGYDPGVGSPPADPALAALWEQVREVTRGPLFDGHRLGTAARLLLSPPAIDAFAQRFPDLEPLADDDLVHAEGAATRPRQVGPRGLSVPVHPPRVVRPTLRLDPGDRWRVLYVVDRQVRVAHDVEGRAEAVRVPASDRPIDQILIFPVTRDGAQRLLSIDLRDPPR